jgi:hypothetical protein
MSSAVLLHRELVLAQFVTCNLHLSGLLLRLALQVIRRNDRDFVEVILLDPQHTGLERWAARIEFLPSNWEPL